VRYYERWFLQACITFAITKVFPLPVIPRSVCFCTIQEIVVKSEGGKRVVAYKATLKGKRAIKLAEKLLKEQLL
jgi:hypothetical protein